MSILLVVHSCNMATWKFLLLALTLSQVQGQLFDRLYAKLQKTLRRGARNTIPVQSHLEAVQVKMSLNPIQLTSLDPTTGDAEIDAWLDLEWTDSRLAWEPAKFNNVTMMRISQTELWNPDIVLYNGKTRAEARNVMLSHGGTVFMVPIITIYTRCDVTNYTSDGNVTCNLKFGSWTYDGFLLDLHLRNENGVDLSNFQPGPWEIVSYRGTRNVVYYACCAEPYPDLQFRIVFREASKQNGWKWNIFS